MTTSPQPRKSWFDWSTVFAAWAGVAIALWTAYHQYKVSSISPRMHYVQHGARYKVKSQEDELIYWRLRLGNSGDAAARDVRLRVLDIPKDAELFGTIAFEVEKRTSDSALIRFPLVPPHYATFFGVQPFKRNGQQKMPFARWLYYEGGKVENDTSETGQNLAAFDVFERLAQEPNYISGFHGSHRYWDDRISEFEFTIGESMRTIEDR